MTLHQLWSQQTTYNQKVFNLQTRNSAEWMQVYLLGLISECGQLLDAMRWKQHRLETKEDFGPNVLEELADITKYVLSMWILMEATPEKFLATCEAKGRFMEYLFEQETQPLTEKVIVFDIDDVLADTRRSLQQYLAAHLPSQETTPDLHLDIEYLLRYDVYRISKNLFEKEGGYATIPEIYPTHQLFTSLRKVGFSIVCYTARPVEVFKRIRRDTFEWFREKEVLPDAIFFGKEARITYCKELQKTGRRVLLVEDEPTLVRRAKNSNIPVICPDRGYNQSTSNFSGDWQQLLERILTLC